MQRRVSLGLLCSALAAACSSDPRTQVIVRIEADPGVEARIERLHVVVENLQDPESPVELDRTVGIGEGDGETTLPAHVPLVPRFGDAERRFRVVAEALEGALPEGGSAFARVEAESSYVRGETRVLVLRFEDDCIEVECNQGTTCRNGACRPSRVDPETLPPWPLDAGTTPSPTDGGMDADANDASDARDAADATDGADARDAPDVPSDCDRDGDGHAAMVERCRGDDCDDSAPAVHPGATETCNGEDDDCDGAIDDGVGMTFYRDVDRDGYGASGVAMLGCTAPEGFVAQDGDCDDANRNVNPGVTETCNGTDDDCDGATDPGCACTIGMEVACGTGMVGGASRCVRGVQRCADGMLGPCTGAIEPIAEVCDGALDEDCDGMVDESLRVTCYEDDDGDGHGSSAAVATMVCPTISGACPVGSASANDDCDDSAATINPSAMESCNSEDDDCDGVVPATELDGDGDGFAPCDMPPDCDDTMRMVNPAATETCNGIDDDCNGSIDDGISCGTPPIGIRPFDGFRTGSVRAPADRRTLRPTFAWTPATLPGVTVVVYEIQLATGCIAGRGCSFGTLAGGSARIAATEWSPTTDLAASSTIPVGTRYAWRVRGCSMEAMPRCTDWSAPRYLDVGRAYRDIDGDGRSDRVVGVAPASISDSAEGRVALMTSDATGDVGATTTLTHPSSVTTSSFGHAVAIADLDADGFDDVVVGAPHNTGDRGAVHAFVHSGASGLPTTFDASYAGTIGSGEQLGTTVASAGDLDGDGYEDVAAGAPGTANGRVVVIPGGPAGLASARARSIAPASVSSFGAALAGGGDENGDGRADLAIGAPTTSPAGEVWVYDGSDTFFATGSSSAATRMHAPAGGLAGQRFGASVAFAGRIDATEGDELVVGEPGFSSSRGRISVLSATATLGSRTGTDLAGQLGASVAGVGDLDGDGDADLAACAPMADVGERCFYVLGNGTTLGALAPLEPTGPGPSTQLGWALAGPFDLEGDGLTDIVVTEPAYMPGMSDGRGVSFSGSTSFPGASRTFGESYSEPAEERFGQSLATLFPRPRAVRSTALLLLGLLLAPGPDPGRAQAQPATPRDREGARAAFAEGVRALDAGQLEAAAAHFERSLALFPNPPAAFNLASTLRQLGRLHRADEVLAALLADTYGALPRDRRTEAADLREAIRGERASVVVVIERAPRETRVTVDGHPMTQSTVTLDPGEHVVRAEAPGHVTVTRRVTIARGATERVLIALVPTAPEPTPAPPPAPRRRRERDDRDETSPPLVERPLFWVGVGAAVVAATVTTVLIASATGGVEDPVRDPVFGVTATLSVP